MIVYRIHADGSLDITAGRFQILGAYPAVDGVPVRPLAVRATDDGAAWTLAEGEIQLQIARREGGVILQTRVTGLERAHDVDPMDGARLVGFARAFRQGMGICGPSGLLDMTEDAVFTSDGVLALGDDEGLVTLHVRDHRNFRNRCECARNTLRVCFDTEGALRGETALPDIHILEHTGAFSDALRACASEIADEMGARTPEKPAFHWCSWYYLYHNLDMGLLKEYAAAFKPLAPFTHLQIDAGYFPSTGDWLLPTVRFPNGLGEASDVIRASGFGAGVWIGPYMVGDASRLFRAHPDWMLKDTNGEYLRPWTQYNEPKPWGYIDCDYYVLDTSHPDAMAYIVNVFKTFRDMGFTLFKTDFLLWGIQDSTKVARHTPGKTSVQYFRDLMGNIRDAIGDARWLGCISPFLPCVGYVDMMRVAADVGANWSKAAYGPENMLQETMADHYFNNVYWQNDPDAVLLRDFHIHMPKEQVEALALWQALTGGAVNTSDPIHEIAPDRLRLLRLIEPRKLARPSYPLWQRARKEQVVVNRAGGGWTVYLLNPTDESVVSPLDWETLIGKTPAHLWRYGQGAVDPARETYVELPGKTGALYFISDAPIEKEPENLWAW